MSTPATQTVWESVRSYLSYVTPLAQLLFAVIVYYYTRDSSATADSIKQFNKDIIEVKSLLIGQGKDLGSFKEWMNATNQEVSKLKDRNHELEKEVIRLQSYHR